MRHIEKSSTRVKGLDLLKLISAFLVVVIHCQPEIYEKEFLIAFCRIAVPIFFIINGFFWEHSNNASFKNGLLRIKKLAMLTAFVIVIYSIYDTIIHILDCYFITEATALAEWKYQYTPIRVVTFILFNDSGAAYQCWYMLALIYTYAIVIFFDKKGKLTALYRYAPFISIIQYFMNIVVECLLPKYNHGLLYRNWLFMALPLFCIGASIGKAYQENKQRLYEKRKMFILCSFLILPLYTMEVLTIKYVFQTYFELYLSTIALALLLFLAGLTNELHSRLADFLSRCGQMYSTSIYCSHVLVGSIISLMINVLAPNYFKSYCMFKPIIVFFSSLLIAILYKRLRKYILAKRIYLSHEN